MPGSRIHSVVAALGIVLVQGTARGALPRGGYLVVPATSPPEATPRHRTIYLNRWGGHYAKGTEDSSLNHSSILAVPAADFPSWNDGDAEWQALKNCIQGKYARFDVTVTDVNPGDEAHIEVVVSGRPELGGFETDFGGIAPIALDCSVVERAVTFVFADTFGGDLQRICEAAAQESAHAFGLDHEFLCEDPMTYLHSCDGPKEFQDVNAECGESAPRPCNCAGRCECPRATQNSVRVLGEILGPARPEYEAPKLQIVRPLDGDLVGSSFAISATARDNVAVESVELFLDGQSMAFDSEAPWEFQAPAELPSGAHTVGLVARDFQGNQAAVEVTVELDASFSCDDGGCAGRNPTGAACEVHGDCESSLCAGDATRKLCSEPCTTSLECPAGLSCVDARIGSGAGKLCWPSGATGSMGGTCAVGHAARREAGLGALALAGLGALASRRRRSRSRTAPEHHRRDSPGRARPSRGSA